MIDVCNFHEGSSPLLVSVPHDGVHVPDDIKERMTLAGLAVPDTGWHVAELYDFVRDIDASTKTKAQLARSDNINVITHGE